MATPTLKVTLSHHALDQAQILVNGRRFGYLCLGEGKKINWLSASYLKMTLTTAEKIAIVKHVKAEAAKLTEIRDAELAQIDLNPASMAPAELAAAGFTWEPIEAEVSTAPAKAASESSGKAAKSTAKTPAK